MLTRHRVDTSVRYSRMADLPDSREIEHAGAEPTPDLLRTELVEREPYVASAELEDVVNLAIALGRPLLLQGDPGAGKTRLAHAVAYALGLPLEEVYIKSTSRGQDLLYTYDAVHRIYDAQLGRPERDTNDVARYIRLGPLGRVIARAGYGRRSVLLIDEIDKADIDFPNDLLRELDQLSFEIDELPGSHYAIPRNRPDLRPIIFVTHNEEKTLPGAFLRRCLFHYVQFPSSSDELQQILQQHGLAASSLRDEAIATLLRLRELDLAKKPGLSELLDWVSFLETTGESPLSLPHAGVLLKQHSDQIRAKSG